MLKVYKTINNGLKFLNGSLVTSHRYIKHKGYVNNISFNKILSEEQNKLSKNMNNCLQTTRKVL